MLLEGKVAIVTGGGTGLGARTAELFAREGAKVAIVGRRARPLEETASTIRAEGGHALVYPGDLSLEETVEGLVERTAREFGGVDILVNNAGKHSKPHLAHETPIQLFDSFIAINLRAPFMLIRAAVPHMLRRGGGAIVNISSIAGAAGIKYSAAYCTAKGGLVHMTKTIALDYADKGITVNCICPGGMGGTENREEMTPDDLTLMAEAIPRPPLGWSPEAAEMAHTVLFLAGPHARHITGAVLNADGGYTAR